ncbi:MAG: dephospho-CoA kinase [Gammaproteobacteria bacterium]|nr:dephospho-CoA kinase [Gammaproteobacteria bacterium]
MALRIGLTGGIASGKSTVANLFCELGITVIDADLIAREVVLPGSPGLEELIAALGTDLLKADGQLDRKLLRKMMFSDPAIKDTVTGILHPKIRETMLQRSAAAAGPYHILDIPLLIETGWQHHLDRVLVVDCAPEVQLQRLIARDGGTREEAQRILHTQSSRKERLAVADDVIDNNHSLAALSQQVYQLHQRYLRNAFEKSSTNR